MKRIVKIGLTTITYTCLVLAVIFLFTANRRLCAAIRLHNASRIINTESNKLWDKKQPHTVVLLKPGKHKQWDIEDIKKFEDGEEKEFIKFLKKDK